MTARVVLACDGEFPTGVRCRQAIPVGEVESGRAARQIAATQGSWTSQATWITGNVCDLCPACTKRAAAGATA